MLWVGSKNAVGREGVKNAVILRDLKIGENWLTNRIMTRKLCYFGHDKRHRGLERTMMEGVVLERRQGRSMRKWILALEDILGMKGNEAGGLEFESFGQGCLASDGWCLQV